MAGAVVALAKGAGEFETLCIKTALAVAAGARPTELAVTGAFVVVAGAMHTLVGALHQTAV